MISLTELLPINERNKVFLRVPNDIKKIYKLFKKNKKQLYIVGGAVRDAILEKVQRILIWQLMQHQMRY